MFAFDSGYIRLPQRGKVSPKVTDEVLVVRFGKLPWRKRQINLVQILIYSSSTASGPPSPAGEGSGYLALWSGSFVKLPYDIPIILNEQIFSP